MEKIKCEFCGRTVYESDVLFCRTCGTRISENKEECVVNREVKPQVTDESKKALPEIPNSIPQESPVPQVMQADKPISQSTIKQGHAVVRWMFAFLFLIFALPAIFKGGIATLGGVIILLGAFTVSPLSKKLNLNYLQQGHRYIVISFVLFIVGFVFMGIGFT